MEQSLRSASSTRWKVSAIQQPSDVSPPREIARRTSLRRGFLGLVSSAGMRSGLDVYAELDSNREIIAHMRKLLWRSAALITLLIVVYLGWIVAGIYRQSEVDEARPADVILVLGAAEYRGKPSPVLRARLDHALALYKKNLAPRILTTGGAGGDPVFTEGEVGRDYLVRHGVP